MPRASLSVRGAVAALGGLLLASGLAFVPASAGTTPRVVVLRDVRASQADIPLGKVTYPISATKPQPDTQTEPSIAVNPANPLNAVAVFQEDRVDAGGDAGNGYAATFNGGRTWVHGYLPGLTRLTGGTFDRASDAVVTFGADPDKPGHYLVYANSLVFDDGSGRNKDTNQSGMAINVSRNGGRTWTKGVVLEQDGLAGLNDKNWLVADNGTGTGHTTGRVYVVWDRIAPMIYSYCDSACDKLASWTSSPANNGSFYVFDPMPGIGSIPLVLPDGSLGIVFQGDFTGTPSIPSSPTDQPDFVGVGSQLMFALAPGASAVPWPAPLTFNQTAFGIAANNNNAVAEQRAGTLPAAAIDPKTGELYVAWEDGRFRSDGLNDIVFSTSTTEGATWSAAKKVNRGKGNDHIDHWNAMIDVGKDGVVHVGYRQRNERVGTPTARSPHGFSPHIDTYYQQSSDHGASWTAPLKANKVTTDVGYAAFSRGGAFLGDYNQVAAASNGTTYVVHNEALRRTAGEKCNCSFTHGNGHQHQFTYVAVIGKRAARTAGHRGGSDFAPGGGSNAGGGSPLPSPGLGAALPVSGLLLLATAAGMHRPRRRPAADPAR
jgi:hypothetical protein